MPNYNSPAAAHAPTHGGYPEPVEETPTYEVPWPFTGGDF